LIGDRAYDSDPLDEELRNDGIEMIAPHRSNRSNPPTQDRRRLSRYMRRWLVERFFAWVQWQRRILVRWEHHAQSRRPLERLGNAGLLWAINGGRLVELHRDWAVIERASDRSRQVHHRERPKAANITLPWIGLR
jgi:transposase